MIAKKSYYILGLEKSGLASAQYLLQKGETQLSAWDDQEKARQNLQKSFPEILIIAPGHYDWSKCKGLILAPGVPHTYPQPHPAVVLAREYAVPLFCDIEIFLQEGGHRDILGVTGTNGKTTTTMLLAHVLSKIGYMAQMGGNIGVPALSLPEKDITVLELSSFQLELMHTPALKGFILLNITPDHLVRHGGMSGYVRAKEAIFPHLKPTGIGIVSVDDKYCESLYQKHKGTSSHIVPISINKQIPGGFYIHEKVVWDTRGKNPKQCFPMPDLTGLGGNHNWQNILATYALLKILYNCEDTAFLNALFSFVGAPHRQELILQEGSVTCINDSKATNTTAARQALQRFTNVLWLVGGQFKETKEDIEALRACLGGVKKIYGFGAAGPLFKEVFSKDVPCEVYPSLEAATAAAIKEAKSCSSPSCVLLSPACASFDAFKNFEARGAYFKDLCHNLMREKIV